MTANGYRRMYVLMTALGAPSSRAKACATTLAHRAVPYPEVHAQVDTIFKGDTPLQRTKRRLAKYAIIAPTDWPVLRAF